MVGTYQPKGIPYGHHDFDHPAPGSSYHVQSRMSVPPMGYTTGFLMDFLEGNLVLLKEAEDEDGTCGGGACVGSQGSGGDWAAFSRERGLDVSEAGLVYDEAVPANRLEGATGTKVIALLKLEDHGALAGTTDVATLTYAESGTEVASVTL